MDLSVIADVSTRFRQYSKICFAHSKAKCIDLTQENYRRIYSKNRFWKIPQFFRHYGEFLTKIIIGIFHEKLIGLILLYCGDTLIELRIEHFDMTDEVVVLMRPVFEHLQKLSLNYCRCSDLLLQMLPLWSPVLRQLEFIGIEPLKDRSTGFKGLFKPFRQLEKIAFFYVDVLTNSDVEKLLKCNSEIKKIDLVGCPRLNDNVIQSIAEYVPHIEGLRLLVDFPKSTEQIRMSAMSLGQLSSLNSLEMDLRLCPPPFVNLALSEICASNTGLKHLCLQCIELVDGADRFVESVSKLNHLETLKLYYITDLNVSHIINICKHLHKLIKLEIFIQWPTPSVRNLLNIVRLCENLELLNILVADSVTEKTCIDVGTFDDMVNILRMQCFKRRLKIVLDDDCFAINVPKEIIRAHKESLSIVTLPFAEQSTFF